MGYTHALHQLCMILCALVGMGGAGYAVATASFDFGPASLQPSIVKILVLTTMFVLSLLLLLATAFGAALPVRWFGMMGSFTGSGLYVMYLGLLVSLHVDHVAGTIGSLACIGVGAVSSLYGLTWREKDSSGYSAFGHYNMEATWYSVGGVGGIYLAHQVLASACAVVTAIVSIWLAAILSYTFDLRATVAPLCVYTFHTTLAVLLFLATIGGMRAPVHWFGIMGSFRGSGFLIVYFGLTSLHHMSDNTVGVVAGYACVGVGLVFVLVGQLYRERSTKFYTPLVYM